MKKLLGIMLCVFTLMLGGCANITADYVIDYLDEIETEGMSARGLDIKDKFEESDITLLAQTLALLGEVQTELEDRYSLLLHSKHMFLLIKLNDSFH